MYDIPIVVVIFNRPECARLLVDALSKVKPRVLYVISDGPRDSRDGERERVEESRRTFSELPWNCTVHREYASRNLGCMSRVSSGLDWVFRQEDRAVILEDDCIPGEAFFRFCAGALEHYANDDRVMSISGSRLAPAFGETSDVIFSQYAYCWGWATWSNRWSKYRCEIRDDDLEMKISFLRRKLGGIRPAIYWKWLLSNVNNGNIDSWAYKWTYTHWACNALSAVPTKNLISNVGVGVNATNTIGDSRWLRRQVGTIGSPITYPDDVSQSMPFDRWIEDHVFSKSILERLRWLLERFRTAD